MNELTKKPITLPTNIKDLTKFILIGREKLVSVRAYIRAIDKLGLAKDVREQKREEANMLAGALLDAEARMGELLSNIDTGHGGSIDGKKGGSKKVLPEGITHKQSSAFQTLAENKDIIEQVKAEAEENDDLPTRTEVLRRVKEKERENRINQQKDIIKKGLSTPSGEFDIIVIDPPWAYGTEYNPNTRRVASPYPEMSLEELQLIEIPSKKDSILWLWTTHKFIWEAKQLLEIWGFEYKAILVWNKDKMGMGEWLRMQCEFCLLGIRGTPIWDKKDIRDIITESRKEHSKKPDAFYQMIDKNFIGRKLDYFAREKRDGWDSFGDEIR